MGKVKVALIIGAGDYLGSAIARRFAKEGFHAVGTRRRGDIASFVKEIEDSGGKATGMHSDARKEEQVVELVERVENEIGPIEVFVFNIGGNVMFSILDTTTRVYTKVWEMCALAGFLTGREVARRMVSRKRGTMLFTGATASVRGSNGFSAFAGGKHALRALAQSMASGYMMGQLMATPQAQNMTAEELQAAVEQQTPMMLSTFAQQGLIKETEKGYETKLTLKDGEASVNGTPIPLPFAPQ